MPNISTVIRGKKVYDAQKDSTSPYYESSLGVSTQRENNSATWQWSQNPALCIRDYLVDVKYGLGESVDNILRSSIDTATDVCNETITLSDTTTQVRYTMDGVIDTGNSLKANIENMTGAMIGRLVYSGGKFELHAGKYVAPTVTIDESMIIGEISVQTKQSRRNAYNGVKGVFLSETDNYILADYPAQISSTYAAQDGDPIYLDMPLPYTVNNIRAQRLAKLALKRSRQQEAITIPCNLNALKFKIGDNISVTNTRLGYSGKVFEVVGYSMGFSADQMVVNVEAIETAASIWDWSTSDEEVFLGAGEVDLYDGTVAVPPASVSVAGDSFLTADGTFSTSFNVSWPDAVDAFTDHYVVEHKLTTASDYFSQQTKTSPFTIIGLQNGQQYNVRVKAVNGIGVSSSYVSATPTAATDTTAPSLPTSITATAGYKSISLAWTNPSQKDFDHVEIHRSTTSDGTYVQVSIAKGGFGAKSEHLDGGLADSTQFYYKFKSVDRSDNKTSDSDFNGQTPVNATTNAQVVDFPELNTALASTGGNVTTIDGGLITTDTITVNKLTGDVTEVYPLSQYYNATLTTTESTIGSFSLPAPQLSIAKRQKIDVSALFEITNSGQTAQSRASIFFTLQKKSKGVNAVQVASGQTVTVEGYPHYLNQLISVSGNHLENLDIGGAVAASVDASNSNEPGLINSLYYDLTANKTYILVAANGVLFSGSSSLYFSDSRFTSTGTWFQPSGTEAINSTSPPDPDVNYVNATSVTSGSGKSRFYLPFKISYGQTTTATDFRIRCKVSSIDTGITYKIIKINGTLENLS